MDPCNQWRVAALSPKSPAADTDLMVGDIIISVDSYTLKVLPSCFNRSCTFPKVLLLSGIGQGTSGIPLLPAHKRHRALEGASVREAFSADVEALCAARQHRGRHLCGRRADSAAPHGASCGWARLMPWSSSGMHAAATAGGPLGSLKEHPACT